LFKIGTLKHSTSEKRRKAKKNKIPFKKTTKEQKRTKDTVMTKTQT
jgi:hypothetical protein